LWCQSSKDSFWPEREDIASKSTIPSHAVAGERDAGCPRAVDGGDDETPEEAVARLQQKQCDLMRLINKPHSKSIDSLQKIIAYGHQASLRKESTALPQELTLEGMPGLYEGVERAPRGSVAPKGKWVPRIQVRPMDLSAGTSDGLYPGDDDISKRNGKVDVRTINEHPPTNAEAPPAGAGGGEHPEGESDNMGEIEMHNSHTTHHSPDTGTPTSASDASQQKYDEPLYLLPTPMESVRAQLAVRNNRMQKVTVVPYYPKAPFAGYCPSTKLPLVVNIVGSVVHALSEKVVISRGSRSWSFSDDEETEAWLLRGESTSAFIVAYGWFAIPNKKAGPASAAENPEMEAKRADTQKLCRWICCHVPGSDKPLRFIHIKMGITPTTRLSRYVFGSGCCACIALSFILA
jgi:hypothetical protein